uniref:Uncharacterized protein n=1 Tax=Candidatus Kentrum sp. SD TaxID=2126332 RepID=A0A450YWW6_9GAMM|nr:MAG: hypothetical protein BECKSD772F_GA0070984_12692 [Candidatus Kentron sp. SD]VFK49549.1 MAG: hypothetical protein BECKSD772E_GA0070983_11903 [Candidatus Kentron sp. SD]VFK80832.1 MAG: hypothetical protein BECKSD772D_GA0070982_11633 [Candidatus Kentron sp. SD]
MTTGSSKRNLPVPALSGGRKPPRNIRALMSIIEGELHTFPVGRDATGIAWRARYTFRKFPDHEEQCQ